MACAFALLATLVVLLPYGVLAKENHAPFSCPEGCYCPHRFKADCTSAAFRTLPLGLHFEVCVLHMANNSLLKLENETFLITNLPYLSVLYLQGNRISSIHKLTFVELQRLRFLYLDKNRIGSFEAGLLSHNQRLEVLSLSYNPLRFPNRGPFLQSDSLRILDLSHCNISRLPRESFVALVALEELRISYNLLSGLNSELFLSLKFLKYLYLSNNNLSHVTQDLFMYSDSLEVLDLSHNKLQKLESFMFHHQSSLQILYLNFNNLNTLHVDVFHSLSNLTELYLHNNSIGAIEHDLFRSTVNLNVLSFDNNSIENLTRDALASLVSVRSLYISYNHLKTFHMRLVCDLPTLRFLHISGNPISCDCDLKSLWEWAPSHGIEVWGSCIPEGTEMSLLNDSVTQYLMQLTCNDTSCFSYDVPVQEDTFLLLVYILSGVCPLVLVVICSVLTVCAFKNHRKNAQEQEVSYNMTTSSTGYLMQDQMVPGHVYSSDEHQNVENCDYAMQVTPVKECTHVSPYSVSPVLYKEDSASNHGPPPIPAMPPKELLSNSPYAVPLSNSPYAVPLGYVREPVPLRSRAFSTSEEEESRPLMRPHHGTLPAASRSSSFRAKQASRRLQPRHQLGNLSSDTEPWSSYSEDASDTVSVTQGEMATWSGSEASTQIVSENNVDSVHA